MRRRFKDSQELEEEHFMNACSSTGEEAQIGRVGYEGRQLLLNYVRCDCSLGRRSYCCRKINVFLIGKLTEVHLGNPGTGLCDGKNGLKPRHEGQYVVPIERYCHATVACLRVLKPNEAEIVSNLFYTARCLEHGPCSTTYGGE